MSEQVKATPPVTPFEYELFEGDPDHLRTVVATPAMAGPWIDPASLKLKHRIGRGPFGDVWLATHHQSGDDFDEYHEVAVKMLHPLQKVDTQKLIDKFETIFYKFRGFESACWLHGISILDGKICIVMKFYEGSVGDRMAKLKGGKLQLTETLRYGIELAKGILDLHSIGILCLNLKPSNFLVNEHDQVFLGDIGISYLLLGISISLSSSNMALRLGTPNYMAPELWEPETRGPISIETDSWGLGCSIVEMLTGTQPFSGKSVEEIYHLVVIKQEKPLVPGGLPPAVENVISGCFEYDFRNRPLMSDILRAFESSKDAVYSDGGWAGLGSCRGVVGRSGSNSYTSWYILKNPLQTGDAVRSRKPANAHKPQIMDVPEGTVVGPDTERDEFVLVRVPSVRNPLRVHVSTLERVTSGFAVGDWVRLKEESDAHSSVGILHSVQRDGNVVVAFIGLATLWRGTISDIQSAESFFVGQFVRLKANVLAPRFDWPRKDVAQWATGRISQVLPNGCLVVRFPGRLSLGNEPDSFLADPCEVELVSFDSCDGVVKKYQHVEDFHWAIRPLVIVLGLLTAVKLGVSIGQNVGRSVKKARKIPKNDENRRDGRAWLRSPVAGLFGKRSSTVPTR